MDSRERTKLNVDLSAWLFGDTDVEKDVKPFIALSHILFLSVFTWKSAKIFPLEEEGTPLLRCPRKTNHHPCDTSHPVVFQE